MPAPRSATNGALSIIIPRIRTALPAGSKQASTGKTATLSGGEADINLSAADNTFAPWQFSNPWFGTVRGRAGIAINNLLLFGTAGLAYGEVTGTTSASFSESHSSVGWVAGLGVEMNFAQHWSAKAEWLYLDLDDRHFSVTAANNGLAANLVRLGLNYHF
jgi:outer membrane immunogenic protein